MGNLFFHDFILVWQKRGETYVTESKKRGKTVLFWSEKGEILDKEIAL